MKTVPIAPRTMEKKAWRALKTKRLRRPPLNGLKDGSFYQIIFNGQLQKIAGQVVKHYPRQKILILKPFHGSDQKAPKYNGELDNITAIVVQVGNAFIPVEMKAHEPAGNTIVLGRV